MATLGGLDRSTRTVRDQRLGMVLIGKKARGGVSGYPEDALTSTAVPPFAPIESYP